MKTQQRFQPIVALTALLLLGLVIGVIFYSQHSIVRASNSSTNAVVTHHYLYTFTVGNMYIFDMDNNHQLVKQVSLPIQDVRGAVTSPTTGMLYISHGGTGGSHGPGALLKYNLLTSSVVWNIPFTSGVDYMGITPNGQTIYLADGDQNGDGKWYVLNANTGAIITTITAGASAHNAQVSLDGSQVYLGGVNSNYLYVASTSTNQIIQKIGPLQAGVRPFTINGYHTLAFINETGLIGFQVASTTTGKVLYTVQPQGFNTAGSNTAFSHGISMSPDEKEIYLMDAPNGYVHVFDITGLPATAPKQVADIKLSPITGMQTSCTYDCQKEGWVQHSLDGRFVYVGDSGDVIDTHTRKIVTALPVLANSRISNEIDWSNNTIVAASTRIGIGHVAGGTPVPTPTSTPLPTTPPGPLSKTWYFAEGRVGAGFREYLTIDNPTPGSTCAANIKYLYTVEGTNKPLTQTKVVQVPATSRVTEVVNNDLNTRDVSVPASAVSAIVTVDSSTASCPGFMVERPVYFVNFHGLSSGTDVPGATQLGTNFYFAEVPSNANAASYLTVLNPGATAANVTVTYYSAGASVGSQTVSIPAGSRGTIDPKTITLPSDSAATVTSTQPVAVERPSYFYNVGGMSGAADIVGGQAPGKDWLFAEGYAAANSQENLTISNFDTASATVTVTLKSKTGATHPVQVTVPAKSQFVFNVNNNNSFNGASPEVSAEVTVTQGVGVVVQREMYYHYHHTLSNGLLQTNSISDVLGMPAASIKSAYSFAEGYTHTGFHEWLTVQNPTANAETIYITLVNGNAHTYEQAQTVPGNARLTVDITAMVQNAQVSPSDTVGNAVSMTVQTLNNGGNFLAERPLYFNTNGISSYGVQGETDIVGYA